MPHLWITPEEARELFERAKLLILTRGKTTNVEGVEITKFATPQVTLLRDASWGTLGIEDAVAEVGVFSWDTGGVREIYGSTARNVLLKLREIMVLEDIASA